MRWGAPRQAGAHNDTMNLTSGSSCALDGTRERSMATISEMKTYQGPVTADVFDSRFEQTLHA
jgi:hypothetical protein